MNVSELISQLSVFDPDCIVECLSAETNWGYDKEIGSFPIDKVTWAEPIILQKADGTIHIGADGTY